MISQYTQLAKVEPIADLGFDFFAKAAQYKSEKIQQTHGALQSTLAGFVNNVDIVKEDDRQYFNEKVKNVVDNLNNFKDLDLSDPNTVYQLNGMLGEVKQDSRVLNSILDTSNFRNVQKEHNLMMNNPKFKDLFHQDLYKADQQKMQEYINNPGARYTQQHASINPKIEEQLDAGFKSIAERKQVDVIGENIVTRTVKDRNLLYQNGQDVVNKNADFFIKTFGVKYDFNENPRQALLGVNSLLESQYNYFKNKKTELEVAQTTTNNVNLYKEDIEAYNQRLKDLDEKRRVVQEGKDVDLIKNIGLKSYMENTALQQANKGYSYISKLEMSDQAKLEADAQKQLLLLSTKNQFELGQMQLDFQYDIEKQKLINEGNLQEKMLGTLGKSGKSGLSDVNNNLGSELAYTVPQDQKVEKINYYQEHRTKRVGLYNDIVGLQKDLVKIMVEQSSSNPKIKELLEKYPDLSSKMYGEKALKSILTTANMLSSLSGSKLDNGATAEGAMKIINQIKEKTLLFNLNKKQEDDLVNTVGRDEDKYNKAYETLYPSTTLKRDISLEVLNNLDKDTRPLYNMLIPEIKKGGILTKDGKAFDNKLMGGNKGEDILRSIDWEKSEKGSFNLDKKTVEIIPRDDKGKLLSDEPIKISVGDDFINKLKLTQFKDTVEKLNKPNTEVDAFVKRPKNSEYVNILRNQNFYIDTNKAPAIPKGTVLEYQITNVKDPIPSAGDSRKDYIYDVNLNIKGKPYSFSVNSTAEIHAKINNYAIAAEKQAKAKFTQMNKQPSTAQLEQETFNIFIDLLTRIK